MNEMNELEMQLRSWAPRRPSAKLRERIFARQATELSEDAGSRGRSPHLADVRAACSALRIPFLGALHSISALAHGLKPASFRWLAPVMAGLFLTCIILNQRNAPMASPATAPLIAMILSSNQSAAAYLPGSFQREQNRLPSDTFEWTNGSGSTSSISSLSESKGRN
jgi:hypothetical protein